MNGFFVKEISSEEAKALNVDTWEEWDHGPNNVEWTVEEQEVFYVLEGEVLITVEDKTHTVKENMIVSLPKDFVCNWHIPKYIKKVYIKNFEVNI